MALIAVWLKMDNGRVAHDLQEARAKLDGAGDEVVLDFSSLCRIDSSAVAALEELADAAHGKGVKIVLSSVNIDIYRVLKLMKLAPRFSFVN